MLSTTVGERAASCTRAGMNLSCSPSDPQPSIKRGACGGRPVSIHYMNEYVSSLCSINGHCCNCSGEVGLLGELTKSGDVAGRLEEGSAGISQVAVGRAVSRKDLSSLGTRALGHLCSESRGQEPGYSAPRQRL